MANKTLIRSKKQHEVKLSEGSQVAQRQQAPAAEEQQVPALIRKTTGSRRAGATTDAKSSPTTAARTAKATTDRPGSRPAAARRSGKATSEAPAPSPRLPARVPAHGLWEADSAVMQRLQALIQHNGQLSEQLQRLQNNPLSKGYKP